jgi:hypothetical protein
MSFEFYSYLLNRLSKLDPIWWIPAIIISILMLYLMIKVVYTIYQMRPITEKEITKWAKYDRRKEAETYFSFTSDIPKKLQNKYESEKPLVDAAGSEITVNIPFPYGPACMSYWLKHKKHQWIIAMYCKDKRNFSRLYGNKGPNKDHVDCLLRPQLMFGKGRRSYFNTVLVFHNHPMSVSPKLSEEDKLIAKERKIYAKENDWNYLEFICIRGTFRLFESHYNSQFKSVADRKKEFQQLTKRGALNNLKLRWNKIY